MEKPFVLKIVLIIEIIILNIASVWWYTQQDFEPLIAMLSTIGAIAYTLFSSRDITKSKQVKGTTADEAKDEVKANPRRKIISALISIAILALVAGAIFNKGTQANIQITKPAKNSKVGIETTVSGWAKNLDADYKIWIVVYDVEDKRFFPHGKEVARSDQNYSSWENESTVIGTTIGSGGKFDIYAIAYKQNDPFARTMSNYFSKTSRDGISPEDLPMTDLFDKITVTLN